MSSLHLLRIPVHAPRLLRFAAEHGITQEDETLGYTLHAWLTALFGEQAPKPFRYFERRNELLAYAPTDAATLLEQARAFASPQAWAALDAEGVVNKPMPEHWKSGQRLRIEVLTCPVARQGNEEKDVFLRALDRLGDDAPPRAALYREWFIRQWSDKTRGEALHFEHIDMLGLASRSRLLRRARNGGNRLRIVERPQALFGADVIVADGELFAALLGRGIGRHRAFGFGMVLLAPPR
jgi:CRISPR system Cascade subunit CasE